MINVARSNRSDPWDAKGRVFEWDDWRGRKPIPLLFPWIVDVFMTRPCRRICSRGEVSI